MCTSDCSLTAETEHCTSASVLNRVCQLIPLYKINIQTKRPGGRGAYWGEPATGCWEPRLLATAAGHREPSLSPGCRNSISSHWPCIPRREWQALPVSLQGRETAGAPQAQPGDSRGQGLAGVRPRMGTACLQHWGITALPVQLGSSERLKHNPIPRLAPLRWTTVH